MGFLWWGRKKENEKIKNSFESIRRDIGKISAWIKHLNAKDNEQEAKIDAVYDQISQIREDIDGLKNFVSFFDTRVVGRVLKQSGRLFGKQTAVWGVQTGVQTAVQTALLRALTSNERLIVWTLANSDLKLSCEDIAVLLGKSSATIRGQINNIKQKNGMLISEIVEVNGKKRYYVDEKVKEMLLKTAKVRVGKAKSSEKSKKRVEKFG